MWSSSSSWQSGTHTSLAPSSWKSSSPRAAVSEHRTLSSDLSLRSQIAFKVARSYSWRLPYPCAPFCAPSFACQGIRHCCACRTQSFFALHRTYFQVHDSREYPETKWSSWVEEHKWFLALTFIPKEFSNFFLLDTIPTFESVNASLKALEEVKYPNGFVSLYSSASC
jgi:hypothetical protein